MDKKAEAAVGSDMASKDRLNGYASGHHTIFAPLALKQSLEQPSSHEELLGAIGEIKTGQKSGNESRAGVEVGSTWVSRSASKAYTDKAWAVAGVSDLPLNSDENRKICQAWAASEGTDWSLALSNFLAGVKKEASEKLGLHALSKEEFGRLLGSDGPRLASAEPGSFPDDAYGLMITKTSTRDFPTGSSAWEASLSDIYIPYINSNNPEEKPDVISVAVVSKADWLVSMGIHGTLAQIEDQSTKKRMQIAAESGTSPLMRAVLAKTPEEVEKALVQGADLKATDRLGHTAEDYAKMRKDVHGPAIAAVVSAQVERLDLDAAASEPTPSSGKKPFRM